MSASDLPGAVWRKSSFSGGSESQCVECADVRVTQERIAVRDSKNPHGPVLMFRPASFAALIDSVCA
ncbi:DUF397 domain-containing protein [Streptomyces sp. NPDC085929]|uniref:DUF397 domain-containing protein n=1 Tax=Streptomyces sp. NPDC085929 TaxID=3365739 RepID=UPI0037D397CC